MATTLYGLPACEVEQPDGEVIKYLVVAVPALPATDDRPAEWRAWIVTSPKFDPQHPEDGGRYRVAEYPSGGFGCDCPANTLGKNRGGRWQEIVTPKGKRKACKHIRGVWDELGLSPEPPAPPKQS